MKALLALTLQKHKEMTPVEACKVMWALATVKPENSRSVVAAISHVWLNEHMKQASVLDNTQMLWSLGTLYSRSNDRTSLDTVYALLAQVKTHIVEATREQQDIDRCAACARGPLLCAPLPQHALPAGTWYHAAALLARSCVHACCHVAQRRAHPQ
jgi:hypothetical protein